MGLVKQQTSLAVDGLLSPEKLSSKISFLFLLFFFTSFWTIQQVDELLHALRTRSAMHSLDQSYIL